MFRLPITNPNPNPSPNPNSDKNVRSTKQHQNKIQHSVIYKSYFRWAGVGIQKDHNRET